MAATEQVTLNVDGMTCAGSWCTTGEITGVSGGVSAIAGSCGADLAARFFSGCHSSYWC